MQETDLILTLPRRIAMRFAKYANLAILEPPIDFGQYDYMQIWHERRDRDPLHIWLRDLRSVPNPATLKFQQKCPFEYSSPI